MIQFPEYYAALQLLACALAGLALGLFHFASLRWTSDHYLHGKVAYGAGLHALRMILLVGVFVLLARLGAAALLAGAGGLLVGRWWVMRRVRNSL